MADYLDITMLPAKEGDCLVVSYDHDGIRKYILIDGGRMWTYKNALKQYLAEEQIEALELIVITHVDRDHIDGMLALIQDDEFDVEVNGIWFNCWEHLNGRAIVTEDWSDDIESFGGVMGEQISPQIIERGWRWNHSFHGLPVEVRDETEKNVVTVGPITLTLVSPDRDKLEKLIPRWKKECEKAGIAPGTNVEDYVVEEDDIEGFGTPSLNIDQLADERFKKDTSKANGASIAFILQYAGKKLLLAGDAHADILERELKKLGATNQQPLKLDAFKVPHHGSKANVSKELLQLMDCEHYLISTSGSYFEHPEDVAMARILRYGTDGATIHFNYKTEFNDYWENDHWQSNYHYEVEYPDASQNGFKRLIFLP